MAIIQEKGSWFLHDTCGKKHWTIEQSALQNHPDDQRCPFCSHKVVLGYHLGAIAPMFNEERDIMYWKGRCCCGTELIVFND